LLLHSQNTTIPVSRSPRDATPRPSTPYLFMALNTSTILNISCPDTALVHKALDLAYAHSSPSIYNHVVRSFLFSCLIGPSLLPLYDAEVVAISTLLHDLGLDLSATSENSPDVVISQDKRFEVDSANAARACM
jgi:hypothetical protein